MFRSLLLLLVALPLVGTVSAQALTVWTPFDGRSLEWLREEAATFSSAFGYEVVVESLTLGELRERMLLDAPDGAAADVLVGVPHDEIGEMVGTGVLADLRTLATRAYLNDLAEPARLAFLTDGRLLGLPLFVEGPALVINRDLVPEPPATYGELISRAQALTDGSTFGFLFDIENFYFSYTWLRSHGGYVFGREEDGDLDTGNIGLANAGAAAGARELRALRHEHGLIPAGTDYEAANSLFLEGSLGMTYNGPWAIGQYVGAGLEVEVVPLPAKEDGTEWSGFMGVYGVLTNSFSDRRAAAGNLAKWLVRPEAQLRLSRLSGLVPASLSALEGVEDPIVAGFGAALLNSEPLPAVPEMGRVWQPMGRALSAITASAESEVLALLEAAVDFVRGE